MRVKRLQALSDLRNLDLDLSLRRLHSLGFIPVAIATVRFLYAATLIMISSQMIRQLLLQSFLQDTLNGLGHQFRQKVSISFESFRKQRRNLLLNLFRWWYPFHGHGLLSIPLPRDWGFATTSKGYPMLFCFYRNFMTSPNHDVP